MAGLEVTVTKNRAGVLARLFPSLTQRAIARETREMADDVRRNIAADGLIDTGLMLGSVEGEASGGIGVVAVNARSDEGFDYPRAQNSGWHDRGGGYHPGTHFFDRARVRHEQSYPKTMVAEIVDAL